MALTDLEIKRAKTKNKPYKEEVIGSIPQAREVAARHRSMRCTKIHELDVDLGIALSLITKCTFGTLQSPATI
jgi:hypothetical protein